MKNDKIQVLVVDDEVEFASTLADRLDLRGLAAKTVNSGTDALTSVASSQPDVMLLDLKMPVMGGFEVLAEVKEKYGDAIEVIMLTGHGGAESGKIGIEHGAFDYIVKPFDFNELLEKVMLAFEKKKSGTSAS